MCGDTVFESRQVPSHVQMSTVHIALSVAVWRWLLRLSHHTHTLHSHVLWGWWWLLLLLLLRLTHHSHVRRRSRLESVHHRFLLGGWRLSRRSVREDRCKWISAVGRRNPCGKSQRPVEGRSFERGQEAQKDGARSIPGPDAQLRLTAGNHSSFKEEELYCRKTTF